MKKIKTFKENFETSIKYIYDFLEEPKSMTELVKWLMTTDANPYSYLNHEWAGMTESAENMVVLLNYIHHAVVDDGDITFVKVNGEPRIVFAHQFDDCFRDVVLSRHEKEMEKRRKEYGINFEYEIEMLDIKPNDFGKVYDKYQKEQVKQWFLFDAKRHGVKFAKQNYEHYNCWDENWIKTID